MKIRDMHGLEEMLGHKFKDRELLVRALTHSSFAREDRSGSEAAPSLDNEQFEFMGDSVLAYVTSRELLRRFPRYREGELSKLRAYLVSARHLIEPARELELGRFLRLGRGEERSGGRNKSAILVDALEAIIAALYQDGGIRAASRFIMGRILRPELERIEREHGAELPVTDYKSTLQERAYAAGKRRISYVVIREEGPEHKKVFTVEARLQQDGSERPEYVARGEGPTKKRAEQIAARLALHYIDSLAEMAK